jgi:hypothetical protein
MEDDADSPTKPVLQDDRCDPGGSPRFLAGAVGEGGDRRLTFTMLDQDVVAVTDTGGPLRAFTLRGQSTLPKGISEAFVTPSSIAFAR